LKRMKSVCVCLKNISPCGSILPFIPLDKNSNSLDVNL
jgi:hypothetical protein